ncbi:hypothetical protein PLANPX_0190 [Lacipirellula parvula]|uniref:DUF4139 domain-containing protein n=2 Tax=Lacipirellula parvula TaxID=2650471 RepID=A0A5K7X1P8_9BACT|nr:hypothetical protein PLANPX_0190 [Lacipirellula parvula]
MSLTRALVMGAVSPPLDWSLKRPVRTFENALITSTFNFNETQMHTNIPHLRKLAALAALLAITATASQRSLAQNIDLSTVPSRDSVQLTIYNSEDITLVRETRVISFKKGLNPLQFSWANTLIDPSSVELTILQPADKLELLDTTFPHDKPQMLYWNVQSEFDGEATVQITYFTSGITWSADYVAIADGDEATLDLEGFVRITNNSGEEYENAQVRLVVGTINLVEKIAQLAQIPASEVSEMEDLARRELKSQATREFFAKADKLAYDAATPTLAGMGGGELAEAKQIVKEGLSEYFIYTVEGTETIPNGWSKRLHSFEANDAPLKIEYRYRPREYGDQLVRMYLLANDEESHLGTTPLPDGVVRVFRNNGRDGLSYLAQQTVKYIPIGDKIELNLGVDPEVVFELVKKGVSREKIWTQIHNTNTFKLVGDDARREEENASVVGWADRTEYEQRIRNYTAKPIDVEIRRTYDGHIAFISGLEPKLHDYQTVELKTQVKPGEKETLDFTIVQQQGTNVKQNNVTLEAASKL